MFNGLPCGISPHSLFVLKLTCFNFSIINKLVGIFPPIELIDISSHPNLDTFPKLGGIVPVIWFLETSNVLSATSFEIVLGIVPVI
ncbi:hypothetical protein HanPI659440_Chr16g0654271 [Helianthus annuus]|nr:hypothetical protein HanPI659440_Chr16g0654271 [Helianthus annuus]